MTTYISGSTVKKLFYLAILNIPRKAQILFSNFDNLLDTKSEEWPMRPLHIRKIVFSFPVKTKQFSALFGTSIQF